MCSTTANSPSLKRPSKPARQWLCSSCLRTSVAPPSCLRVDLRKFVNGAVRAGRSGVGSSTQTLVHPNKGRSRLTELVAPQRRWRTQGLRRGKTMGRSNWQADTTDPYMAVGSKGADRQFMSPRKVTATGQKPGLGVANVGWIGCFLPDRLATERPETRRDRRAAAASTGVQSSPTIYAAGLIFSKTMPPPRHSPNSGRSLEKAGSGVDCSSSTRMPLPRPPWRLATPPTCGALSPLKPWTLPRHCGNAASRQPVWPRRFPMPNTRPPRLRPRDP